MKNLRDSFIGFFQDENIKNDIREIVKPILKTIYKPLQYRCFPSYHHPNFSQLYESSLVPFS